MINDGNSIPITNKLVYPLIFPQYPVWWHTEAAFYNKKRIGS